MKYFCALKYSALAFLTISIFSFIHGQTDEIPKKKLPDSDFSSLIQLGWKYKGEKDVLLNNEFIARRLRLGIETKYWYGMQTQVEVDLTDDEILKDAKIVWKGDSDFRLTLGKQKIPFSHERLTSVKKLLFVDRAETISEIDELQFSGRDFGLTSEYKFDVTDNFKTKVAVGIFNGNGGKIYGDNNNSKTFAERIEFDFYEMQFGFSASHKNDSLTAKYISAQGVDFKFKEDEWTILTEFASAKKENGKTIGGYFFTANHEFDDWSASVRFENYYKNLKASEGKANIIAVAAESAIYKEIKYSLEVLRHEEETHPAYFEILLIAQFSF